MMIRVFFPLAVISPVHAGLQIYTNVLVQTDLYHLGSANEARAGWEPQGVVSGDSQQWRFQ